MKTYEAHEGRALFEVIDRWEGAYAVVEVLQQQHSKVMCGSICDDRATSNDEGSHCMRVCSSVGTATVSA